MGLAGCAPSATGSGDATAKAGDITWDEEFDVIVVGAGIAGNAAALTVATEGNGASCLLIEKGSTPSGNSPFCKGDAIWTKDVAAMSSYMKELSHGTTPDDVLEAYAQGLGEIYDWVIELGANKEEMSITEPTSDPEERNAEYHELENSYAFGYFAIGKNTDVEVKGPDHVQVFLQDAVAQHSDIVDYRTSPRSLTSCKTNPAPSWASCGREKPHVHPRKARRHSVLGRLRAQPRDDAELSGPGSCRTRSGLPQHGRRPSHLRAHRRRFLAHEQLRRVLDGRT